MTSEAQTSIDHSHSSEETQPTAAFIRFADVAEKIGATTKRLEKAALLGEYLSTLGDADLPHAARYFAGYIFPLRDQRKTNIGGAALMNALVTVTGAELETLQKKLVKMGDLGDVAQTVISHDVEPTLELNEIAIALEQLAKTKGSKQKQLGMTKLLQQATPLEAKYLIKLMAEDLRIGLREGAVEDAIARLAKKPVEKIQWVNMLTGDIGETALLARHDRFDHARMRLFHPIKFMLASPAEDLDEIARQMPNEFAVEDKYDGIRAQIHLAPNRIAAAGEDEDLLHGTVQDEIRVGLFSRTLDEITKTFPDLLELLVSATRHALGQDESAGLILDGEIVPFRDGRILPFQELQKRLGRKTLPETLLAEVPVAFIAYDVLYQNGHILINEPYETRQSVLSQLELKATHVRQAIAQRFTDVADLDAEFQAARDRGNEGLMVKDPNSTYKPGRRGKDWLKVKRAIATLDVVVTAAEVGTGKRSRFLSDFTFAVRASETDPTLLNVGKAYSGLTDEEITHLSNWFRAHTIQEYAHGKVCVVEPKIVLEVTFDRVQPSKRHKGGYALRFPRILRIRDDKPPEEIDTLETVRRLAETESGNSDR
jgi:DNA ligase 1